MPTYEYRCAKCGEHLEIFQSFSDAPLTKHASCGGKLSKVMSAAGVILKGSGFYKTDNRSSSKGARKDKSESTSSSSESTTSTSSDAKSSSSSGSTTSGDKKPAAKSA